MTAPLRVATIRAEVARQFRISEAVMISGRRAAWIAQPRQVSMYLARRCTHRSLAEIARMHGATNHTTTLHACKRIAALIKVDPELSDEVRAIEERLEHLRTAGQPL